MPCSSHHQYLIIRDHQAFHLHGELRHILGDGRRNVSIVVAFLCGVGDDKFI
jgi:hypothetical protein